MTDIVDELLAMEIATKVAAMSPCQKSQRGVVIFHRERGVLATGFNHPPPGFRCDGVVCRQHCDKVCIHAENEALALLGAAAQGAELLHMKVVDEVAVPTGGPSCWQCSREILNRGIGTVWLLHENGLARYSADRFHVITLLANHITPVVDVESGP